MVDYDQRNEFLSGMNRKKGLCFGSHNLIGRRLQKTETMETTESKEWKEEPVIQRILPKNYAKKSQHYRSSSVMLETR